MLAVDLIAIGRVSGTYEDLATETAAPLENGVPGNRLGGVGSGLAYAGGTTFLALPDRGPNANPYNPLVDDTVSYIPRFHTFNLSLAPSFDPASGLPFTLTPMLLDTTLLSSPKPLVYGTGAGLGFQIDGITPLGSGAPALNDVDHTHYFTGRSDNFDPNSPSTDPDDARLDAESIRVSNNGHSVYISDEYGPYVYEFDRSTGKRVKSFTLPANLAITHLSAQGNVEIDPNNNSVGRVANKGMEGLAITPDGKMLVGIMQANLEQDAKGILRIVTIAINNKDTREYAYQLTDGSGASDIVAVNDHQFLVDERDGAGLGDKPLLTDTASAAKVKKLYLIDVQGASDVTDVASLPAPHVTFVGKAPFLDIVSKLSGAGIDKRLIPSKLEGVTFGQDVVIGGMVKHTLYVANDNDFLPTVADPLKLPTDPTRSLMFNPNQFFVFAFDDNELPGYVPQQFLPKGSQ
ncbi:MAG TPA: esterase-like activity of phytase family protein [Verrucomicrobiae bacterium]|nr:esterase-like activity of phytase family protein [Verrucomicrobiae bacterium]